MKPEGKFRRYLTNDDRQKLEETFGKFFKILDLEYENATLDDIGNWSDWLGEETTPFLIKYMTMANRNLNSGTNDLIVANDAIGASEKIEENQNETEDK